MKKPAGHEVRMGENKYSYMVLGRGPEVGKQQLKDLGIDDSVILKLIMKF